MIGYLRYTNVMSRFDKKTFENNCKVYFIRKARRMCFINENKGNFQMNISRDVAVKRNICDIKSNMDRKSADTDLKSFV